MPAIPIDLFPSPDAVSDNSAVIWRPLCRDSSRIFAQTLFSEKLESFAYISSLILFCGGLRKPMHFETESLQGYPRSLIFVRTESACIYRPMQLHVRRQYRGPILARFRDITGSLGVWDRGLMTRPVSDRPRSWSCSFGLGLSRGRPAIAKGRHS